MVDAMVVIIVPDVTSMVSFIYFPNPDDVRVKVDFIFNISNH